MNYLFIIISKLYLQSFSDCCKKSPEFGEQLFKGVQRFNSTQVSKTAKSPCYYNPESFSYRKCVGDMKNGPHWEDEVDLTACKAKSEATNQLIQLKKVR